MDIKVSLDTDALVALSEKTETELATGVTQALQTVGDKAVEDLKNSLSGTDRSGRNYIASAAGEPPNSRNGKLRDAMTARVETDENSGEAALSIGDLEGRAPYALFLEYGTAKAPARPFLFPAAQRAAQAVQKRLAELLGRLCS